MIRYFFEWHDTENALYRVEIFSDLYSGSSTEITGYAGYSRESSDLFQPLQITALDLRLVATVLEPLEDLWEEDDRYWMVKLEKDATQIFLGHISADEVEQPFVQVPWEISIEARDPLGFLEDLSFVDGAGAAYTGFDSVIKTIAKAVKRGFRDSTEALSFKVITNLALSDNSTFEDNAYVEMVAFMENEEPQSCKEVVEELLKAMGCIMFQYFDSWVIINVEKYTELITTNLTYREYDEDGVFVTTSSWTVDATAQRIGSNVSSVPIFHVNKNQSFINRKYFQSVRIKQKYEYRDQIIPNGELEAPEAFPGPYTMPSWTLTGGEATAAISSVLIRGVELLGDDVDAMISTAVTLKEGNNLIATLEHEYIDDPTQQEIEFKLVGQSQTYFLRKDKGMSQAIWIEDILTTQDYFILGDSVDGIEQGDFTHRIEFPPLPVDGDLTITYRNGIFGGAWTTGSRTNVKSITIEAVEDIEEGIEHTVERTDNTFGRIPDVVDVRFATADTSVILNTFFDSSGVLLGEIKPTGASTVSPSLRILATSMLTLNRGRTIEYTGDIKGNVEHLTPKRIDIIGGNYLIGNITKNLENDTANMSLLGYNKTASGATVATSERIVYKESVKPKIK